MANLNQDAWTVYTNDNKKLVFAPGDVSNQPGSTTSDGAVNINTTGDLSGTGAARFTKEVRTADSLYGKTLCLGDQVGAQCLTDTDIMSLKKLLLTNNSSSIQEQPTALRPMTISANDSYIPPPPKRKPLVY
jgi:hypothetical protein